jgi:hypothetical protein
MGLTTLTSTMKITAAMMRAPSAVLGMYWKKGVKKRRDKITKSPDQHKRPLIIDFCNLLIFN